MPRKRTKGRSPRRPVEKKAKTEVELRQQVLPTDALLDVFNFSGRRDLDKWLVVSRQYCSAIQRAQPLRRVEDVVLYYDGRIHNKVYRAVFRYAQESRWGDAIFIREVRKFSKDFERLTEIFVDCLRFCFVRLTLEIGDSKEALNIDQNFVGRLKSICGDYNCRERSVSYGSITLEPGFDVFDLICAFPHYRTVNKKTLALLREHVGLNDGLLRSLASRGIWSQTDLSACNEMLCSGMDGKEITEDGILDFAFGDYSGDEEGRRLHVYDPQVSTQFISKLVKAARSCKSAYKLEMNLTIGVDLDIDDFVANGQQLVTVDGFKVWKFDFAGLSNLHVHYVPKQQDIAYWLYGKLCCWRNATPTDY